MFTTPNSQLSWLPPCLDDLDMPALIEAAYRIFKREIIARPITIDNKPLLFSKKMTSRKEEDFYHIIVGGKQSDRAKVPSKMRCRYITWVRPILDHYNTDEVASWENKRSTSKMKCISPKDFSSIVVMRIELTKYFFVTAYPAENPSTSARWQKDYQAFLQNAEAA